MKKVLILFCMAMACRLSASAQRLQGSPLLFGGWVRAEVESRNPFFANDSLLYNYDKQRQVLLATADRKTAFEIGRKEFQRVTFSLDGGSYTFKHVPVINDKDLFEVVVEDSGKYCLYLFPHTTIRGRSYVEWYTYYLVFPFPDSRIVKLEKWDLALLKRKFVLSPDSGKVDVYYSEHDELGAGEEFLRGLVLYLDQ